VWFVCWPLRNQSLALAAAAKFSKFGKANYAATQNLGSVAVEV
jgi:hypothetical protein